MISGESDHQSDSAKYAHVRFPMLRLISKFITYGFFHRNSQNDKPYPEDLWLLSYFHRKDPTRYVNAAYVLAEFMEKKGCGLLRKSPVCCGHFITKMIRTLGLFTKENCNMCRFICDSQAIGEQDLDKSHLLNDTRSRLIYEGEQVTPAAHENVPIPEEAPFQAQDVPMQDQGVPGYQPFDFSDWTRQFNDFRTSQDQNWGRLNQRLDVIDNRTEQMAAHQVLLGEEVRYQGSRIEQLAYNQEYFHPHMTHWARGQSETSHVPVDAYQGPPIYTPLRQYGGYGWTSQQQQHRPGGSSSAPGSVFPIFGTYSWPDGDGEPSIFGPSDDAMQG